MVQVVQDLVEAALVVQDPEVVVQVVQDLVEAALVGLVQVDRECVEMESLKQERNATMETRQITTAAQRSVDFHSVETDSQTKILKSAMT